jgi:LuxR family maltose regulon positive regulatory protein
MLPPIVPVIQSKLTVPPLSERVVARPRVSGLLAGLIIEHPVVWVRATAGAGKTTAGVQAAQAVGRPIAWLTIDDTDAAPGRLLTYLEAALAQESPGVADVATGALAAGIPHAEAAGLLAEATGGHPLVLVLDGLERLAGAAESLAVLAAFVRYAPPTLRILLLSRVDLALDLGTGMVDRVAEIGETTLAFTVPEAADALAHSGRESIDPQRAVAATGGWVTGVLFEAWCSSDHVAGSGGETDPLNGYLATQILGRLDPAQRDFLETTSLLDEVTAARAEALGQARAGDRLVELRAQHLPVTWVPDSRSMRCHPRFREYLLERLERRGAEEIRALRQAYGELLMAEGHSEDAVEQFLATDAPERALEGAGTAIRSVVERLDFPVAERWLAALAHVAGPADRRLTTAELMLAIGEEDYPRGGAVADRLAGAGQREVLAGESALAASMMAWCYWHLGRVDEARVVVDAAAPGPEIEATLYLLRLVDHTRTPAAARDPHLSGGPLDALVMRVHYAHGRLHEVSRLPESSWAAGVTTPWRVGALRAVGRTEQAVELYRAHPDGWTPAWMHGIVGAELMIDLGDLDEARTVIARGRVHVADSGSVVFAMLNQLIEAKLELRLACDPDAALAILDDLEAGEDGRRYAFIAEQSDTWRGMALLMRGPGAEAVEPLTRAVASMCGSGRILELPTAAVLLAEARWRAGDEDGADRAVDEALATAEEQGSNHHLLQALSDFPAVLARRLDAEAGADSQWAELGRALMARGVPVDLHVGPTVELREFGEPVILADGRPVRPRIAKSVALLAVLATAPDNAGERDALLDALFDGRNDDAARSYLRQAAHRLRQVLPHGVGPAFDGSTLRFADGVRVASDSLRFEALVTQAARLQGAERLAALQEALALFDGGPYLHGLTEGWVGERRERLETLAGDTRVEAAQLAFNAGRYQDARALAETALRADPFRESAWRLVMRVASVTGDEDGVIDAYRRCRDTLSGLGAEPSASTQQLLGALRR